jgi:hypothetical protein
MPNAVMKRIADMARKRLGDINHDDPEHIKKAHRDAALDAFYRFTENCPMYANQKGVERLRNYLVDYGDEYERRWLRRLAESLGNFRGMLENTPALLAMIDDVELARKGRDCITGRTYSDIFAEGYFSNQSKPE